MANPRLVAVVTALLLISGPAAKAQIDVQMLRNINVLIDRQDWTGLRSYIEQNSWILSEDGALARELRYFVSSFDSASNAQFAYTDDSVIITNDDGNRSTDNPFGVY